MRNMNFLKLRSEIRTIFIMLSPRKHKHRSVLKFSQCRSKLWYRVWCGSSNTKNGLLEANIYYIKSSAMT